MHSKSTDEDEEDEEEEEDDGKPRINKQNMALLLYIR